MSAVQNGLGIALLPTYFCESVEGIVPLDLGLRSRAPFWLSYHPAIKEAARVRAVIDWIKGVFDRDACPWFRDEFHPPKHPTPAPGPLTKSREVALRFSATASCPDSEIRESELQNQRDTNLLNLV